MNTIQATCKNDDCDHTFRVPEYTRPNSTIKTKLDNLECRMCKNKKLLAQSTLYSKNQTSRRGATKNTGKKNKAVKSPHDRFYKSTAWWYFSRYVLLYYSIDGIYANCCTCGNSKALNNRTLHTGHWIKVFDANSTNNSTAFEFTNLGPQCYRCNNKMGGRERLMQIWLTEKHGAEEIERLQVLSKQSFRLDDYTFVKIAKQYKQKFNDLLQEKNWKNPWKK